MGWADAPLTVPSYTTDADGGLKFQITVTAIVPRFIFTKDDVVTKGYFWTKEEVWPQSPVMTKSARALR
jgi:hypothetical protein